MSDNVKIRIGGGVKKTKSMMTGNLFPFRWMTRHSWLNF